MINVSSFGRQGMSWILRNQIQFESNWEVTNLNFSLLMIILVIHMTIQFAPYQARQWTINNSSVSKFYITVCQTRISLNENLWACLPRLSMFSFLYVMVLWWMRILLWQFGIFWRMEFFNVMVVSFEILNF